MRAHSTVTLSPGNTHEPESYVDVEEHICLGETDIYETDFPATQAGCGHLYRDARKRFGRCISKVYVDRGSYAVHIGWCFVKRYPYDDDDPEQTFLRHTWVTIHMASPTVTRTPHVLDLNSL